MTDFQKIPLHGTAMTPLSSSEPQLCPLLPGLYISSAARTFLKSPSSALDFVAALFHLLVLNSSDFSLVLTSRSFVTSTLCYSSYHFNFPSSNYWGVSPVWSLITVIFSTPDLMPFSRGNNFLLFFVFTIF